MQQGQTLTVHADNITIDITMSEGGRGNREERIQMLGKAVELLIAAYESETKRKNH